MPIRTHRVCDASAGAHVLHAAARQCLPVAHGVGVAQLAAHDVAEDLGVPVRVRAARVRGLGVEARVGEG